MRSQLDPETGVGYRSLQLVEQMVAGPEASLLKALGAFPRTPRLPRNALATPGQQPAQPHESDTATLQTLAHPPQGHGSGLPVCVLLGDTLHTRKMHLTPRVYGH